MSNYQFLASNSRFDEYDNGIVIFHKKKLIINHDERYAMRIIREDDLTEAMKYTKKKYCAYIEWLYCESNAQILMDYIKGHLHNTDEIELWNVWMGEKSAPQMKKCRLKDLRIASIKEIWGKDSFRRPECLRIYAS